MSDGVGKAIEKFMEDGGIVGAVLGKHMSNAVGRLINGVVDYPMAHLQAAAQRVKDDMTARSAVSKAVAKAAASRAAANPAIIDRAMERLVHAEIRRQINREAVALKVIELVKDDPPGKDHPVDPDFFDRFEKLAEDVSGENLRDLFARVLAGEIRKPKTYSLGTLQFLSIVDEPIAADIRTMKSWCASENLIVRHKGFNGGGHLSVLRRLIEHGLVDSTELQRPHQLVGSIAILYPDNVRLIIHMAEKEKETTLQLPFLGITRKGEEILSLLDADVDPEERLTVGRFFLKPDELRIQKDKIERVELQDIGKGSSVFLEE